MLYIIPTPIGNLQDITLRAIALLKDLEYIICEDTRSTKKLMQLLSIPYEGKQFFSLTSFSSQKQVDHYVALIQNNDVGLVSDAGTPGLSDPGKKMVEMCHTHALPFTVLPGANALLPVVVASGFDTSQFVFVGFLPKKKGKQTLLMEMVTGHSPLASRLKAKKSHGTMDCHVASSSPQGHFLADTHSAQGHGRAYFFYESVHRISKVLQELYDLGFRGKVSIGRELTKMHEQLLTDDIEKVLAALQAGQIPEKGEFVVGVRRE